MALVTGDDGQPMTVTVPVGAEQVVAQVWRVDVGRVPLFLLDADRPENGAVARWITLAPVRRRPATLRLAQYLAARHRRHAGAGGDGHRPGGRAPQRGPRGASPRWSWRAPSWPRAPRSTTRWPRRARARSSPRTRRCPAGNDTYAPEHVARVAGHARRRGRRRRRRRSLRLGRTHPDDDGEPFGVTQFALRTSRAANGVSRRHGEVAREMWAGLWPDRPVEEVPIGHVTNGVHVPTWVGGPMRALLDRHLGEGWMDRAADPATWAALDAHRRRGAVGRAPRAARRAHRARCASAACADRLGRDEPREYVGAAASFDPDVADDRVRAAPGHVQAPRPAAARRRRGIVDLLVGRAPDPAVDRRQGAPARRRRQAHACRRCSRPRASPEVGAPRRVPRRLRPRHRRAARRAAATCGSTCRARRWRPAARAG